MRFPAILRPVALATVVLCTAWAAPALTPNQILVVANENISESVALGRYYCANRNVPQENLVILKLSKEDTISWDEYRRQLLEPIRRELMARKLDKQVTCILTVYGVPFRIKADPPATSNQILVDWSGKAAQRAQGRLATDVALLRLVGTHFPSKAAISTSVERRNDWFEINPPLAEKLPSVEELAQTFSDLMQEKVKLLETITDPTRRTIAARQILAVNFDAGGLLGLQTLLKVISVPGVPDDNAINARLAALRQRQTDLAKEDTSEKLVQEMEQILQTARGAVGVYRSSQPMNERLRNSSSQSAIDNELSLLWWREYSRDSDVSNPLNWRVGPKLQEIERTMGRPLMVSRIDGPTVASALRLIKDSIATEKTGLKGAFYIDAGGKMPEYDLHLRRLAELIRTQTSMPVTMDDKSSLFPPGSCKDAALYVGWYSLKKYIPAFQWNPGSVGYHIASFEAMNIHDPKSSEWVPRMITEGVAGTMGATDEPFLQAFPLPEEFFPLLMSGKVTIAEAYWRTLPTVSWRLMLIADPLYAPFKNNPYAMKLPVGLLPSVLAPLGPLPTLPGHTTAPAASQPTAAQPGA